MPTKARFSGPARGFWINDQPFTGEQLDELRACGCDDNLISVLGRLVGELKFHNDCRQKALTAEEVKDTLRDLGRACAKLAERLESLPLEVDAALREWKLAYGPISLLAEPLYDLRVAAKRAISDAGPLNLPNPKPAMTRQVCEALAQCGIKISSTNNTDLGTKAPAVRILEIAFEASGDSRLGASDCIKNHLREIKEK